MITRSISVRIRSYFYRLKPFGGGRRKSRKILCSRDLCKTRKRAATNDSHVRRREINRKLARCR